MKSSIPIFFMIFLTIPIFAQAPDTLWTRTFGSSGWDMGYSFRHPSDENKRPTVMDFSGSSLVPSIQDNKKFSRAHITTSEDTVIIQLSLVSITDDLTFNQSHVPGNFLEYEWSIYLDSDSNSSTGNSSGFDVSISLTHFKPLGSNPFNGTILGGTQKNTWIRSGSVFAYGHAINAHVDTSSNSIVMIGSKTWPELENVDELDRFNFQARYYSVGGYVTDITVENNGVNHVTDSQGDVPHSFIDIVEGNINITTAVAISEHEQKEFPDVFVIKQNYPNPFNPTTNIEFSIPKTAFVTLKIYNILGEEMATLVSERLNVGQYKYEWDAKSLSSGVYLYRIQAGNYVKSKKMVLLR